MSNAKPRGLFNCEETNVETLPLGSILIIVLLPLFATYKLPEASNARPCGLDNSGTVYSVLKETFEKDIFYKIT